MSVVFEVKDTAAAEEDNKDDDMIGNDDDRCDMFSPPKNPLLNVQDGGEYFKVDVTTGEVVVD